MDACERLTIPSDAGGIPAALHLPAARPSATVVFCHGLLSSKDGSKWIGLADDFTRHGYAALRFDFAGCGESTAWTGPRLLDSRLSELHAVLDHVVYQPWCDRRIALLGSSLGGYLALIAAADRGASVGAVICWATPFDLSRVGQALRASSAAVDSPLPRVALGSPKSLDRCILPAGVLVIHGAQDELVACSDAIQIYERVAEPKRLIVVENADHRFLDPQCRGFATRSSIAWCRERLG